MPAAGENKIWINGKTVNVLHALYVLWFNFILALNFIFFCFKEITYITVPKNKGKSGINNTTVKVNHKICIERFDLSSMLKIYKADTYSIFEPSNLGRKNGLHLHICNRCPIGK